MPELDPDWEYWTPDPEIAELMGESTTSDGFEGLGIEYFRNERLGGNVGFRFGTGNPNNARFRLAPERYREVRESRCRDIKCSVCGITFKQYRPDREFCSRVCANAVTAEERRERPQELACVRCGKLFDPARTDQVYCGRVCAAFVNGSDITSHSEGCRTCGGVVPPSTSRSGIPRVYCSPRCKKLFIHRRHTANKRFLSKTRSGSVEASPDVLKIGDAVMINTPENPRLHGTEAEVLELADWGAYLRAPAASTGQFRAAWSEMVIANPIPRVTVPPQESGFTGDICRKCGSVQMIRAGACLTCVSCGESSGCG